MGNEMQSVLSKNQVDGRVPVQVGHLNWGLKGWVITATRYLQKLWLREVVALVVLAILCACRASHPKDCQLPMMPTVSVSLRQASGTRSIVQAKVKATTKRSTKRKEKVPMTAKIAYPRIKEPAWMARSVNSAKSSSGIRLTK